MYPDVLKFDTRWGGTTAEAPNKFQVDTIVYYNDTL